MKAARCALGLMQRMNELHLHFMTQMEMGFMMNQFRVTEPIQILLLLMPKLILMFH